MSACLVVYTYCWNSVNLQQALGKPSITPVLDCTFTSVSSDESKFLEDFMTFASDFSNSASKESKESRASLTELTVCDRTGNLSRPLQEVQAACTVGLVRKIMQIFKYFLFLSLQSQLCRSPHLPPYPASMGTGRTVVNTSTGTSTLPRRGSMPMVSPIPY